MPTLQLMMRINLSHGFNSRFLQEKYYFIDLNKKNIACFDVKTGDSGNIYKKHLFYESKYDRKYKLEYLDRRSSRICGLASDGNY